VALWLHAPAFFRASRSDPVESPALPLDNSSSRGIRYPFRVPIAIAYPGYGFPNPASPLGLPPALRFSAKTLPRAFKNTLIRASHRISRSCRVFRRSAWPDLIPFRVSHRQLS
jgi:hypothetical protein